mmetsp:Transcript_70236/g.121672  ORF Transcript_70236/g.121672 Transcript_70236/m.121672 type:complete len:315 (+) Transcript_70236:89-1033(+)
MAANIILEEQIIPDYEPTEKEMLEYAEWLGFDMEEDRDLLWLARDGLKAPLPRAWKPCQTEDGEIFYFNFETGASEWDHPVDEHFRQLLRKEQAKKRPRVVGTLTAAIQDSGSLRVVVTSMGGNELAGEELQNPHESLHDLQKRLKKQLGKQLQLVLSDGRLLGKADKKTALADLLGVSVPTPPVQAEEVGKPAAESKSVAVEKERQWLAAIEKELLAPEIMLTTVENDFATLERQRAPRELAPLKHSKRRFNSTMFMDRQRVSKAEEKISSKTVDYPVGSQAFPEIRQRCTHLPIIANAGWVPAWNSKHRLVS